MTAAARRTSGRREDPRFLRGEGQFLADLVDEDTLHVHFVRSPVPSARIVGCDVAAARAQAGVHAVLGGTALADMGGPIVPIYRADPRFVRTAAFRAHPVAVPLLATDRVRFVGQPVAVVVADQRHTAEDAGELVVVDFELAEPVLSPAAALAPGGPAVWPDAPDNVAGSVEIRHGEIPTGPDVVTVDGEYRVGRHSGMPLETRGAIAEWDPRSGRVTVTSSTQIPNLLRRSIAGATGWPADDVRVVVPDVGGGFGTKANIYPEEHVVALLARHLRRRVAWVEDRLEHFVATGQSRDRKHHNRMTLTRDGRILGYEDDYVVDIGAYNLWLAGVLANTAVHALGPYRVPAYRIRGRAVYTNKTSTTQYRGAGRPEACFALERLLDKAATVLGVAPTELRRRNLLQAADLPWRPGATYHDGVPIEYDGGDYRRLLDVCVAGGTAAMGEARRAAAAHERVGVGYAMFVEGTGLGPEETAVVSLQRDGTFLLHTGAASAGQGQETTLPRVASRALAVAEDDVTLGQSRTDAVPSGVGSYASRSAVVAGSAALLAAEELAASARDIVAALEGVTPAEVYLTPQGFVAAGGAPLSWAALARRLAASESRSPDAGDTVLRAEASFRPPTVTWTAGAHCAIVAVDRETGLVRVLRYLAVDESGRLLDEAIAEGQVTGGIAQGIGGALLEEFRYDESGQPQTGSFADYLLPASTDVPPVDTVHVVVESSRNPLGVKGIGESGTIAPYAAVAAAVESATGVHVTATPVDPAVLAEALDPAGDRSGN